MGRPKALSKRVPDEVGLDGKDHYQRSSKKSDMLCAKKDAELDVVNVMWGFTGNASKCYTHRKQASLSRGKE